MPMDDVTLSVRYWIPGQVVHKASRWPPTLQLHSVRPLTRHHAARQVPISSALYDQEGLRPLHALSPPPTTPAPPHSLPPGLVLSVLFFAFVFIILEPVPLCFLLPIPLDNSQSERFQLTPSPCTFRPFLV